MSSTPSARIRSVDCFRIAAIIAVISIHTAPFSHWLPKDGVHFWMAVSFNSFSHFAVPFFFTISGYFWGQKILNEENPARISYGMIKRLGLLFFAWNLFYLLPWRTLVKHGSAMDMLKQLYWSILFFSQRPALLLFEGTRVHLWFLTALICSIAISGFFIAKSKLKPLLLLAVLLYVFGILAGPYANSPLGISLPFNTRNGPFMSTLFFATGYCLARQPQVQRWWKHGLILFAAGLLLHIAESATIGTLYDKTFYNDFVFGTYFMGVGATLLALSDKPIFHSAIADYLGKMTLGIYAIHFLVHERITWQIRGYQNAALDLLNILVIAVISALLVVALSRNKYTRHLVM